MMFFMPAVFLSASHMPEDISRSSCLRFPADSSRLWPADGYEPGHGQPSFDKQFARDWLKANDGNHNWTLPQEIVDKTIEKYLQAYEMLTGKPLA